MTHCNHNDEDTNAGDNEASPDDGSNANNPQNEIDTLRELIDCLKKKIQERKDSTPQQPAVDLDPDADGENEAGDKDTEVTEDEPVTGTQTDDVEEYPKAPQPVSPQGPVVFEETPRTFHSQARTDCQWSLLRRRHTTRVHVGGVKNLRKVTRSEEYSSKQTQKKELKRIVKLGLSQEIKSTLGLEGISSTSTATASAEQINETVNTYVEERSFILVHYIITISGTLQVRKDWTFTELYDWVGDDCTRSDPWENVYTLKGPAENIAVSTTYHVWEMRAPSIAARGNDWAEGEAERQQNELLRRGAWLPELPRPEGLPPALNVG